MKVNERNNFTCRDKFDLIKFITNWNDEKDILIQKQGMDNHYLVTIVEIKE